MKTVLARLGLSILALVAVTIAASQPASAYTNNRLMDDAIFDSVNTMNEQQIRNFINSRPSSCLATSGAIFPEPITYWQYGGNVDAARVIYNAAQYNELNPQVILATLQKEQSLISRTDCYERPSGIDSRNKAMGQGCPDNGECPAPAYAGFHQQVMKGAWQLKFNKERANGNVEWGDNGSISYGGPWTEGNRKGCSSCASVYRDGYWSIDGQWIKMETGATASFYRFTPHLGQALPRIFEGWFGSTTAANSSIVLARGLQLTSTAPQYINDTLTANFQVQNTAAHDINAGGFGVCARVNGQNYDLGFTHQQSIPANSTVTITHSRRLDVAGTLSLFICSYNEAMGGWVSDRYPYSGNLARQLSVKVWENPVINAGIGISPANPAVGQLATATLSIKNFSAATTWVGTMVIAARDPSGRNVDFEEISNVTLAPGATYTYSKTRTFNTPGDHSLFIVNWRGGGFDRLYPKSIDGNIVRQTTVRVLDNPIVSSGVTMTPAAPAIGQPATVSVSIRNASASAVNIGSFFVAARSPSGRNLDFPEDTNISIAPNTVYTYSKTQTFTGTGDHSLFMVNWRGGGYDRAYPKSLDSSIARQATVQVVDNPLVTGGITLSPTSPTSGQTVTASVAIRNASAQAVNIGSFFIAARDPLGNNIDFPEDTNIVIPANSTYTYSKSKPLTTLGKYSFFMVNWRGGGYDRNYPKSADSTVVRQLDFRLNQ